MDKLERIIRSRIHRIEIIINERKSTISKCPSENNFVDFLKREVENSERSVTLLKGILNEAERDKWI